ncbi:hypothetical protein CAEBREN_29808 [Caenorhabditis brenneri]|uniref:Uncharacterized protein n=1 Tax=Caenorhabditis brenneri TaxID=135651 RepID=G0NW00_CAEBE|nr:hypothetical protein CAEBREN_29808 [Caenorhabditis brenneri]
MRRRPGNMHFCPSVSLQFSELFFWIRRRDGEEASVLHPTDEGSPPTASALRQAHLCLCLEEEEEEEEEDAYEL